jgi:hypothetical protein
METDILNMCFSVECKQKLNMATLRSFVSEGDVQKFFDILSKIKNGTLKNEVSVLILVGQPWSGKSTLIDIMRKISKSVGVVNPNYIYPGPLIANNWTFEACNENLVRFGADMETDDGTNVVENAHNWIPIHTGMYYRKPAKAIETQLNPGVFVVATHKRPPVENFKKHKRMPLILELPNLFDNTFARGKVVEECVKEFSVLNTFNARKASLFFVHCSKDTPLPLEIVVMIAQKVWGTRSERCWLF